MYIEFARPAAFRGHVAIAALMVAAALVPSSSLSQVLPSGAEMVGGVAAIGSSGGRMDVTQSSPTAIISWETFSVGEGGHVHFDNGSGATLNRVRGNVASQIDGKLSATGSLYLINPNGIAVGGSGTVETGGSFVASTLDLADDEFARAAAGQSYTLTGDSNARVLNAGRIGSLGGDVVLAAREVENSGDIEAPSGAVGLLAGNEVLIKDRDSHDGRFLIKSRGAGTSVKNTGNIKAVEVELRANGGNVYALAGNRGGVITATGSAKRNGRIFLTADDGGHGVDTGRVGVTGTLNARQPSKRAGAAFDGGRIDVRGRTVRISGSLNAHGSVAAANPEMLPPPRPQDPLLEGYGGQVMVYGQLDGSGVSTASVNVEGVNGSRVTMSYYIEDTNAPSGYRPRWEEPQAPPPAPPPAPVEVKEGVGEYIVQLEGGGTMWVPEPAPVPEVPAPPAEEPAPVPEVPAPPAEESAPIPEVPAPPAEEPAPVPEVPAPPAEEPVPVPEVPAPPAEEPAPILEVPAPPAEEPAPVPEIPAPPAEEPAPVAEVPAPPAEEPAPVAEVPAPPAEEPVPVPEVPAPPAEEPAPVPALPAPPAEEAQSEADESASVPDTAVAPASLGSLAVVAVRGACDARVPRSADIAGDGSFGAGPRAALPIVCNVDPQENFLRR